MNERFSDIFDSLLDVGFFRNIVGSLTLIMISFESLGVGFLLFRFTRDVQDIWTRSWRNERWLFCQRKLPMTPKLTTLYDFFCNQRFCEKFKQTI